MDELFSLIRNIWPVDILCWKIAVYRQIPDLLLEICLEGKRAAEHEIENDT